MAAQESRRLTDVYGIEEEARSRRSPVRDASVAALAVLWLVSFAPAVAAELTVCANSDPPFLSIEDGTPQGLEYDLLQGFARFQKRGVEIQWSDRFADLFAHLEAGDCELVAGMLTPTAERRQRMDFSRSYFPVRMVVLSRRGEEVRNAGALAGKRVATVAGTSYDELLRQMEGVEVVYVDDTDEAAREVAEGRADALVCDSAMATAFMADHGELVIDFTLSDLEGYAFAMSKGSTLRKPLDRYLESIREDGSYTRLLEKYLDPETVRLILTLD